MNHFYSPVLCMTIFIFILGAISGTLSKRKWPFSDARFSIIIYGLLVGVTTKYVSNLKIITPDVASINPADLLAIYCCYQGFKLFFNTDAQIVFRNWKQTAILASLVYPLCSIVGGIFLIYALMPKQFSVTIAIIFGSMIAHPCAFEAQIILSNIPFTKHLQSILFCESIFTEAITIFFYFFSIKIYEQQEVQYLNNFIFLLRYIGGGSLIGVISGFILIQLLKLIRENIEMVMLFGVLWSIATYHISEELQCCGCLADIIVAYIMLNNMDSIGSQAEYYLVDFWRIIISLVHGIITAIFGIYVGRELLLIETTAKSILVTVVSFILFYIFRIAFIFLLGPLLMRVGYGLTANEVGILAISVSRGGSPKFLAWMMAKHKNKILSFVGKHLCINLAFQVMFCALWSLFSTPWLLKMTGMSKVSITRRKNMTHCLKHIEMKTDNFISILKRDRFLRDAKWSVVHELSKLENPYSEYKDVDKEDETNLDNIKTAVCPDCLKEILPEPSIKQLRDMNLESRYRILKAKKVAYRNQFEKGLLSKEGFRSLNHAVDIATESKDALIELDELFKILNVNQISEGRKKKKATRMFFRQSETHKEYRIPMNPVCRFCYRIISHPSFEFIIYIVIILNCIPVIYEILLKSEPYTVPWFVVGILDFLFGFIYIAEFFIVILGLSVTSIWYDGFYTYFRSPYRIFDFMVLMIVLLSMCLRICDFIKECTMTLKSFQHAINIIRFVRLLRITRLFGYIFQHIKNIRNERKNTRSMLGYEIAKSYVIGDEKVEDMIVQTIDNRHIREDCTEKIKCDRLAITKFLGIIYTDKAYIAYTVKTKQACITVLNGVKESIDQLRSSGWLDEFEYNVWKKILEKKIHFVNRIQKIIPNTPREIFKDISWINDAGFVDYLFRHIVIKIYDSGDIICAEESLPNEVHIIVSGVVKISYLPNHYALNNLYEYGCLPVIDCFGDITYNEKFEEYITVGHSFGELSLLTGRALNCNIYAETPVQTYSLHKNLLSRAFDVFFDPINGLEAKMWKAVAIKIGKHIIHRSIHYSLDRNEILYYLSEAFVLNLNFFKIVNIPEMVEDVILVEGNVADYFNHELYTAPCYIPRNVKKLLLPNSSQNAIQTTIQPKLLFIPSAEINVAALVAFIFSSSQLTNSGFEFSKLFSANVYKSKRKQTNNTLRKFNYKNRENKFFRRESPDISGNLKPQVSFSSSILTISLSAIDETIEKDKESKDKKNKRN